MSYVTAYAIFLAQVCKHSLTSELPTPLDWSCTTDLVVIGQKVVEDCLIGLPIGFALQPARVVSHPAAVLDGQISARPDLSVGGCGPSI